MYKQLLNSNPYYSILCNIKKLNHSKTHFTYLNGSLCMESTLSFLSSNDGGTGERNLGQANAKHASNSLKSPAYNKSIDTYEYYSNQQNCFQC